jgi:hypothetical protein
MTLISELLPAPVGCVGAREPGMSGAVASAGLALLPRKLQPRKGFPAPAVVGSMCAAYGTRTMNCPTRTPGSSVSPGSLACT